jgi:hypothetical protein
MTRFENIKEALGQMPATQGAGNTVVLCGGMDDLRVYAYNLHRHPATWHAAARTMTRFGPTYYRYGPELSGPEEAASVCCDFNRQTPWVRVDEAWMVDEIVGSVRALRPGWHLELANWMPYTVVGVFTGEHDSRIAGEDFIEHIDFCAGREAKPATLLNATLAAMNEPCVLTGDGPKWGRDDIRLAAVYGGHLENLIQP